ncbi:MAG TPA: SCO family protein [Myxococcaceae bacterium]|nr:SCO family protein [Myxococcaceae bacterium]
MSVGAAASGFSPARSLSIGGFLRFAIGGLTAAHLFHYQQTMTDAALTLHRLASRLQTGLAALVGKPPFWLLFVLVGIGIPIARTVRVTLPKPLPALSTVPDFKFTDQNGAAFGSEQLRGKVWVANAIFTRCPSICTASTERMAQIQHRGRGLGEHFHLVSFSVDPEYDAPEKLLAYAKTHRASPRMWSFLTGSREELTRTLNDGLKIYMGKEIAEGDDLMSIGHGSHFALVDSKMRIRGYYDLSDDGAVDALLRDAGLLASRGE